MEAEYKIGMYAISFLSFMIAIAMIGGIMTAVSNIALKMFRPEIFDERRKHEKEINKMRRELNKALSANTELKKQMNTFTFTQPKTDHNVYIKSKNDYQV